ncbi:Global transcription regulator sge1, partial [Ophidiomyces ophidiicola]
SELERALVGSLVDSYGFKDSGLVKKTMSVTVSGVTHHLVSYYSVEDVMRGVLNPPSMVESLKYIRPRPELTTKQSFRAPIDDLESASLDDNDPNQALYGYRPPLVNQAYQMPSPNYYPLPGGGYVPHPQQPGPMQAYAPMPGHAPYMQPPSAAQDMPPKTEEYGAFRGPPGYAAAYDNHQPLSHLQQPGGMGRPPPPPQQQQQQQQQQPQHAPNPPLYRTPTLAARAVPDMPTDPRGSFSVPPQMDGNPPLDQRSLNQSPYEAAAAAAAARRNSSTAYYNGDRSQAPPQQQQQQPPPPPSQQHQRQLSAPHHSPQQQSQQSPYYGGQAAPSYQSSQPPPQSAQAQPMPPWGSSASGPTQV